jgi:SAM-dependent methyltransferase
MPSSSSNSKQGGSFEDAFIRWLASWMPLRLIKHLPTFYYWINQYRFRLLSRPVMVKETSRAHARRVADGFFDKYFIGQGIDIGYGGDLVHPNCRGWDVEHGDAHYIAALADHSFDFVYSSHLIEHLEDPALAVRNWWRILKPGGYLILYLPERDLFERKRTLPSDISLDHKHFFLLDRDDPPDTIGLIPMIHRELPDAEIVYTKICDAGYRADAPVAFMSDAEYSIELVAQKKS